MCRSQAQGGQRCAAHTRPRYESATFGTPEWDDAAAAYASTPQGRRHFQEQFLNASDDERSIAIHGALSRGERMRAVAAAVASEIQQEDAVAEVPQLTPDSGTSHVYRNRARNAWITCHSLTNARRDAAAHANRSRAVDLAVSARSETGSLEQRNQALVTGHARVTHNGQGAGFTVTGDDLKCSCPEYQERYDCEHVREVVGSLNERINQERVGRRHAGLILQSVLDQQFATAASAGPIDLGDHEVLAAEDRQWFTEQMEQGRANARNDMLFEYVTEDATGGLGAPDGGRGFGVELEFVGGDTGAIARELHEAGLTPHPHQEHYHANHGNISGSHQGGWHFEEDCTVDGEIISPVMYDTPETWRNLATVCDIVRRNGGAASVRAGSHVHVSTANYGTDAAAYQRLSRLYHANEDVLYRVATDPKTGQHRVSNNSYCRPNREPTQGFASIGDVWAGGTGHGVALNFAGVSGRARDNVEFRLWDSTLDPSVIQTQITTSLAMAEAAYRDPQTPTGTMRLGASRRLPADADHTDGVRRLADVLFRRRTHKARLAGLFGAANWSGA